LSLGIAFILTAFVACDNGTGPGGGEDDPPKTYALGDTGPGGGKIFYVSEAGFTMTDNNQVCHYLEAAPSDMSTTLLWATSSYELTNISGTGTAIGTGRKNTALILATDSAAPAALACKDLTTGGKNDWFLPSKDELNALHTNRSRVENLSTNYYWSSSQSSYSSQLGHEYAWHQLFSDGYQGNEGGKYTNGSVRAVRAF
jgi:hypothetical protein